MHFCLGGFPFLWAAPPVAVFLGEPPFVTETSNDPPEGDHAGRSRP